ncbi:hypothetical protein [Nocardia sp. NPDC051832]|uniref:hypothetical protein n=1 Tax=Nocardia sp. NPDC051832 TaxID=3155673 RepID=UPI003439EFB8
MTSPLGPRRRKPIPKPPPPSSPRRSGPAELMAAAQAAVEAAQAAAGQALETAQLTAGHAFDAAVRLPPASAQLVAQLPDLVENLATAVDRLNTTIDRLDRTLALADPAFAAYDRLLPRLEAMISMGEDVFGALAKLPGVSLLGKVTGFTAKPESAPDAKPGKSRKK